MMNNNDNSLDYDLLLGFICLVWAMLNSLRYDTKDYILVCFLKHISEGIYGDLGGVIS